MSHPYPHQSLEASDAIHRSSSKRKRGLPPISTIPPTPPTSSPPFPPLPLQSAESFSSISSAASTSISTNYSTSSKILKGIPYRGSGLGVNIHEHKNPHTRLNQQAEDTTRESEMESTEEPGSPRSKVANTFQGLRIEELDLRRLDAGAMMKFSGVEAAAEMEGGDCDEAFRKRAKVSANGGVAHKEMRTEIPETPGIRKVAPTKRKRIVNGAVGKRIKGAVEVESLGLGLNFMGSGQLMERTEIAIKGIEVDPDILKGRGTRKVARITEDLDMDAPREIEDSVLGDSSQTISSNVRPKPKGRKRAGTPPLKNKLISEDGEVIVFDPERAALTWHDDEITGHDPTDPDDDGEGINGIGFKPTASEAYARKQKRRQQMIEYRNREAKEARAKRSERRRGKGIRDEEREEQARRVRFMEEMTSIISTN